ncbi:MAG: methionine--tRNA ligase [Bacillota bacterium]|jgi:methionyl-tRNA synthetase
MSVKETFYITTPIYYPSDNLHIGHAYTTVAADTIRRYKKMRGFDTYFLTGSDEHGQKIQYRAAEAGKEPQEFVDEIVANFRKLWQVLSVEYDDFIRTTEDRHKKTAQKLFQAIYDKGDIYKAEYEGWYCTPCETFLTKSQLAEGNICPDCGRPVEKAQEESYFFKMSKYADRWLEFVKANPDFIQPESRRNEMINFVKQGLDDLCVSRTTFSWGIPVPFDKRHVIYVWFDALINYVSALGLYSDDDSLYRKYWPADLHLVGKDIIRFHTVIWPIILMSAALPIPHKVFGHGWLMLDDGKMSKSKGNVVDPGQLVDKYGVDAVRYFLIKEMGYGLDASYSEENLLNRTNIDLANDYGNLLSRVTSMINKFQEGIVLTPQGPGCEFDDDLQALAARTVLEVEKSWDDLQLSQGLTQIWQLINRANKYIDEAAPWALNKAGEKAKLATVLYNIVEILRIVTIMIEPVMPNTPLQVWQQLGIEDGKDIQTWESLSWGRYPYNQKIQRGEPLFPRLDESLLQKSIPAAESVSRDSEFEPVAAQVNIEDFAKLDFRVVEVLAAEKVKKTDKLLKLSVLMGEEKRTVVAGIAQHYEAADLVGKKVIMVANLQPVKLRGIESQGMILAASHDGRLELPQVQEITAGGRVK